MDCQPIPPDCPLSDWPEVNRIEIRELLVLHDETLGEGIDRAVEKLRSLGIIIKEE
jgi:hypothetical protein